ncbi:RluA family pseudouridine synthase [Acidocella aminolytica]|uniref:Ribosomal 23S RNA pseudouridine synthase n=2 Tax=Acidocella TaxID=50709 RepID=A0A0D6PAR3_9PROT|nr:RNA pseudouridine synthase [Acidocella aminolytica]GAN78742.1 ribosomal 23S RNA pseudouridine synthase [Acidocella aminolytica 101 = DSM 11237]SHE79013.1 tRNA pseudouridine32 synthase / 23S rRNA pseudouridine746 synthase [Acidocella aminolytica 101 = DSM 11237]
MAEPPGILFQDNRALVVNKPAGLPAYPGRAGGTSVEDFFPSWRRGKTGPWLAHRLDQDTAGCLLIARRKTFLLEAQALMAAGGAEKLYWAILRGIPSAEAGEINAPLAKLTEGRRWRMAVSAQGAPARTFWRVLGAHAGNALVEFKLLTGRTHQIRAHAAHLGHPVLADPVYGGGPGPMCLLARHLALPLAPPVAATAPPPPHMSAFVETCLGTV